MFDREPSLNSVFASVLSVDVHGVTDWVHECLLISLSAVDLPLPWSFHHQRKSERNRSLKNINRVEHTHEPCQTHTVKEDACESNKGGQMNSVERVSTME